MILEITKSIKEYISNNRPHCCICGADICANQEIVVSKPKNSNCKYHFTHKKCLKFRGDDNGNL